MKREVLYFYTYQSLCPKQKWEEIRSEKLKEY